MWSVSSRRDYMVGLRAARVFDGERIDGIISASWTGEGDDSPFRWHMLHADGDEEDLSLEETRAAIVLFRTTRSAVQRSAGPTFSVQPALRDCDDATAAARASASARARR